MPTLSIADVPRDMIYEIAMGVGTPLEIARRHGYTDADFIILNAYKWFERAVQAARTELESAGFTFERKMAMLAEDLMIACYHAARAPDTHVSTKLDVAKQLAKLGRLEPNPTLAAAAQAAGAGFSISINFSPARAGASLTLDTSPPGDRLADRIGDSRNDASALRGSEIIDVTPTALPYPPVPDVREQELNDDLIVGIGEVGEAPEVDA